MSETQRPRRVLRRIGAVLAIFVLSTDVALHATGAFYPDKVDSITTVAE